MNLKKALDIAFEVHKDQLDKAGEPYILHPLYLMMRCGTDEDLKIIAVLHDVIEDGGESYKYYLKEIGFKYEILEALDCLTRKKNEDYFSYIDRIKTNSLAKKIKILDLEHNSDLERLKIITNKDLKRVDKYTKAINILLDE